MRITTTYGYQVFGWSILEQQRQQKCLLKMHETVNLMNGTEQIEQAMSGAGSSYYPAVILLAPCRTPILHRNG